MLCTLAPNRPGVITHLVPNGEKPRVQRMNGDLIGRTAGRDPLKVVATAAVPLPTISVATAPVPTTPASGAPATHHDEGP